MDNNEHNNEAEALFATKRKQQQAEEAERKRLEELEQQKRQMAEEVKRLEALQAAQREQEARMAWEAQQAQQAQWAQQTNGGPGTGASPAVGKNGSDPKKKKIILISALAGLAVVLLVVFLILILGSKSKPTDETNSGQCDESSKATAEDWGEDVTPFYGMWQYDEFESRIGINADGTWSVYDSNLDETSTGVYRWKDGWLVLENADGKALLSLCLGSDERLYDDEGDSLSRYVENPDETWGEDDPDLLYLNGHSYKLIDLDLSWMDARAYCVEQGGHLVTITSPEEQDFLSNNFYDQKLWIGAFESETGWCWVTGEAWYYENWRSGEPSGGEEWCGCLWTDMEWNDIRNEDPGERVSAFICEYDELEDVADEGRGEKMASWFEDHDMYVNYRFGDTAKTVVGGASVRGQDSHSYTRIPGDWYVEQNSYQSLGDGNCLITLTANVLTDGSTMPAFVNREGYTVTWSWSLCDYYSGVILTEAEDDTFYAYNYDVNGKPVHIEFCYSHDVVKYKDLSYKLELTLTVRMPEDYDGLVLVCYNTPESDEVKQQRDLIYEGQIVLPVDEFPGWREMGSGLICKINE